MGQDFTSCERATDIFFMKQDTGGSARLQAYRFTQEMKLQRKSLNFAKFTMHPDACNHRPANR